MESELLDNLEELETEEPSNAKTLEIPSLSKRIQASFIDVVLILIVGIIGGEYIENNIEASRTIKLAYFIFVFFLYEPLFTSLGCTFGQSVAKIRVRNFETQKKIMLPFAILRYIIKYTLGWISFFTVHANDNLRAIHDLASRSVVIDVSKIK
jgi:uncharacterized RDD family membrane protein YckC